ncbi:hypothetical protein, partial [Algoriphagus sp. PAP.12]|uniref:hypothetical protein n=1 Tax=Algoriphagus sp. PAP.12 TaxID=2996678 RepID=UPI00227C3E5D
LYFKRIAVISLGPFNILGITLLFHNITFCVTLFQDGTYIANKKKGVYKHLFFYFNSINLFLIIINAKLRIIKEITDCAIILVLNIVGMEIDGNWMLIAGNFRLFEIYNISVQVVSVGA